ncbi:hypothetical protein D9M72_615470 [compost metagenome]
MNTLGWQLFTFFIRNVLDDFSELHLQIAWQIQAVIGLENVSDTALTRLRIDADDRFIGTANILRIDWQIWHFPDR